MKDKIQCDCCNKYFKGLWKDYREIDGIVNKVFSCGHCKHLSDSAYTEQCLKSGVSK